MRKPSLIRHALVSAAVGLTLCIGAAATDITALSQITDLAGEYELTADVRLSENFVPIGSENAPFTGTFNGGGFTVSGGSYAALFACTDGAEIRDLNVTQSTVGADTVFGGIVGTARGATLIEGCSFSGTLALNAGGAYAIGGGIVGTTDTQTVVKGCTANVSLLVSDKPYYLALGGIVGKNGGTVSACRSFGTLEAVSDVYRIDLGGIVAENSGTVEGCRNGASVKGSIRTEAAQMFVGGVVGCNSGTVTRSQNLAELSGTGISVYPLYLGGVAGMNCGGKLELAKNAAVLTASKTVVGGVVGYNLGHKTEAELYELLNSGTFSTHDSLVGGLVGVSTATESEDSAVSLAYALNLSDVPAVGNADVGTVTQVYSIGEADRYSTSVSAKALCEAGLAALEEHRAEWVSNASLGALPDLLLVTDTTAAELIPSMKNENGAIAWYLYSPDAKTDAKSFTAVYYDGSRYLGSSTDEATSLQTFTRLAAKDIPEETTRIKFIAFASPFSDGLFPSHIESAQVVWDTVQEENDNETND